MDYEALGRYTAELEIAARERNRILGDLSRLIRQTIDTSVSGVAAMDFDCGQASELLEKAIASHQELARAAVVVNSVAQAAGKPELRML